MSIQDKIQLLKLKVHFDISPNLHCMLINFKLTIQKRLAGKNACMNIADLNINKIPQDFCVKVVP